MLLNGQYHSIYDRPVIILSKMHDQIPKSVSDMTISFVNRYECGVCQRPGKIRSIPTVIIFGGSKSWWKHGNLHRTDDKPAYTDKYGNKTWWINGKRHRDGGKPAVINENDEFKEWWINSVRMGRIYKK